MPATCPKCKNILTSKVNVCPHCGTKLVYVTRQAPNQQPSFNNVNNRVVTPILIDDNDKIVEREKASAFSWLLAFIYLLYSIFVFIFTAYFILLIVKFFGSGSELSHFIIFIVVIFFLIASVIPSIKLTVDTFRTIILNNKLVGKTMVSFDHYKIELVFTNIENETIRLKPEMVVGYRSSFYSKSLIVLIYYDNNGSKIYQKIGWGNHFFECEEIIEMLSLKKDAEK